MEKIDTKCVCATDEYPEQWGLFLPSFLPHLLCVLQNSNQNRLLHVVRHWEFHRVSYKRQYSRKKKKENTCRQIVCHTRIRSDVISSKMSIKWNTRKRNISLLTYFFPSSNWYWGKWRKKIRNEREKRRKMKLKKRSLTFVLVVGNAWIFIKHEDGTRNTRIGGQEKEKQGGKGGKKAKKNKIHS